MQVSVVGLGYIGLPTALMMAASGTSVVGVDYNKKLIDSLKQGKISFEEYGLEDLFQKARQRGIQFSEEYIDTPIYVIAVPTPYDKFSKKIDASYVINAVANIMNVCTKGAVIVIESTISPGTIDKHIRPLITEKGFVIGQDLHIVHAPERIIPGNMIYELVNNSRTIGADNSEVGEMIKQLYSLFCSGHIIVTDIKTAEMTKVVENTFRDINIAFANELAMMCRRDNIDVYEVINICNMHPRVNILQPGPGVGGHCIPVDPWFLVGDYPGIASLTYQARKINDSMPEFTLGRIADIMKDHGITDTSRIGLYGLAYKEDVDDIRESPTLQILESMEQHLAYGVKVYDPVVKQKDVVPEQYYDFEEFLDAVDMVVIIVAHSHIKENMDKLKGKVILDTRNVCPFDNAYKL